MIRHLFLRNAQARDHLELFLVSGISSLLLLRFYLHLTGYPQVGGGSLHIAHMLWGGLLMMAALVCMLAFLGTRVQRLSAVVGGIGFGIFIDELGKFITKDNNYFFRPTIGLIYAIFSILFLSFNFISRRQRLSTEEYQINALKQFEEAVLHHMDSNEKDSMRALLLKTDQKNPITQELNALLNRVAILPSQPNIWQRYTTKAGKEYTKFWKLRNSNRLVGTLFIAQAALFVLIVIVSVINNFDDIRSLLKGTDSYASRLLVGQVASSLVAGAFVITGTIRLYVSRIEAYEWFRRAVLVNLFLTEFFIFSRIQFGAIPGFILNLALLLALRFADYQERHSDS